MDMLHGRQRRYFGYTKDTSHKVNTPESAKSFRSVISPVKQSVRTFYQPKKTFTPNPSGQSKFADKIIHRAIKTQIPGLIPALQNSTQYEEDEDAAIKIRCPDFEKDQARSLHYFFLSNNDQDELAGIFHRHLMQKDKRGKGIVERLSGRAAKSQLPEKMEYLGRIAKEQKISRGRKLWASVEFPSRIHRANRKFQIGYWDPTTYKGLGDPFNRCNPL